jgi:hypothetical protein
LWQRRRLVFGGSEYHFRIDPGIAPEHGVDAADCCSPDDEAGRTPDFDTVVQYVLIQSCVLRRCMADRNFEILLFDYETLENALVVADVGGQ